MSSSFGNDRNLTRDFDGHDQDGKKDIIEIDGVQQQQLRQALLSAFPSRQMLEMLVSDSLNKNLSTIAGDSSLEYATFELIRWAMAKGKLEELVNAAIKESGQNSQLLSIAKQLKLRSDQNAALDVNMNKISQTVPMYSSAISDKKSADRVAVVPARVALDEYFLYGAYICQPHRYFRPCVRIAFYTKNKIDRHIPKILGQIEAISRDEIETRTDLSDGERIGLRALREKMEFTRSEGWSKEQFKIFFLTPPDSPETLVLPNDIENDLTSSTSTHRRVPFTQNQRYVSLLSLENGPRYTSELEDSDE